MNTRWIRTVGLVVSPVAAAALALMLLSNPARAPLLPGAARPGRAGRVGPPPQPDALRVRRPAQAAPIRRRGCTLHADASIRRSALQPANV
jgi:hypothetical protein